MKKNLILALGFIFFVWLMPVLFIWIESKGGYISIKGGKVASKYAKFIMVVWTIGWAIAATMLVFKVFKG